MSGLRAAKRKYKGVPWIKTGLAKPYKRRLIFAKMQCAMMAASAQSRLMAIRCDMSTPAPLKSAYMAEAMINTMQATAKIISSAKTPEFWDQWKKDKAAKAFGNIGPSATQAIEGLKMLGKAGYTAAEAGKNLRESRSSMGATPSTGGNRLIHINGDELKPGAMNLREIVGVVEEKADIGEMR